MAKKQTKAEKYRLRKLPARKCCYTCWGNIHGCSFTLAYFTKHILENTVEMVCDKWKGSEK